MLTRDQYIAILEKRATEEKTQDSQDAALAEFKQNTEDSRKYLGGLFDHTSGESVSKLFPGSGTKESGNPFLKVARALFLGALAEAERNGGMMKQASPAYLEVAFRGFCEELEKIAAIKPQTLSQVTTKNMVAASRAKPWDVSGAASAMGVGGGAAAAPRPALAPVVEAGRQRAALPWYKRILS